MKLNTYLNFNGNCQEAFRFYEKNLGGTIVMLSTYGDRANMPNATPEMKNAVLHARIQLGGTILMGSDTPPGRHQPMRSAYLSLSVDTSEEAERVYGLLKEGGEIFMAMEETFFAHRFAMLRDRFGTSWMIIHERPIE